MAAVFLDIEKAFDTTWHNSLLYKLSKCGFSASLIKPISSFLSNRKFSVSVEGEMSTPKDNASRDAARFRFVPYTVQSQTIGVHLALFSDDTCLYATKRKEGYVLKLQRGLNSMAEWSKRWKIKINEDNTQAIYFSHRIIPP
jgi:hypothetical protein